MARLEAAAILVLLGTAPAPAQVDAVGPCSPYRAADGDIPSELPGCLRRRRPAPGSLADELDFRRAARPADAPDATGYDDDAPRRTSHRRVPRRGRDEAPD